jgi:hypothetical protein
MIPLVQGLPEIQQLGNKFGKCVPEISGGSYNAPVDSSKLMKMTIMVRANVIDLFESIFRHAWACVTSGRHKAKQKKTKKKNKKKKSARRPTLVVSWTIQGAPRS